MQSDDISKTINGVAAGTYTGEHTGMMVYHTGDICTKTAPGIYVWDGNMWQSLDFKQEEEEAKDVRMLTDNGTNQITLSYNGETTSYYYASFGAAGIWMTQNLATKYLPDGSPIDLLGANDLVKPQYSIPGGNTSITGAEGLLYNWSAAMAGFLCSTDNQRQIAGAEAGDGEVEKVWGNVQGICPKGWHLPSDREWNQLEKELTNNANLYTRTPLTNGTWQNHENFPTDNWEVKSIARGTVHGSAMKSTTAINGYNPLGDSKPADQGGFDLLLVGLGDTSSSGNYGGRAYLWSSSSSNIINAWARYLFHETTEARGVARYSSNRIYPFSVRCKKD